MQRRSLLKMAMMSVPFMPYGNISESRCATAPESKITMPTGLKEEAWEIAQQPGRISRLCPEARIHENDELSLYAYALYMENGNCITTLHWHISSGEMVTPKITFNSLMSRLAPKTWKDLIFGLALHKLCLFEWTQPEFHAHRDSFWSDPIGNWPKFRSVNVVDALLEDSRGAILWTEQLHSLCNLFHPDHEAANQFRKALAARRVEAWERARALYFADGISLADVIEERMVFGMTCHPDIHCLLSFAEHVAKR